MTMIKDVLRVSDLSITFQWKNAIIYVKPAEPNMDCVELVTMQLIHDLEGYLLSLILTLMINQDYGMAFS